MLCWRVRGRVSLGGGRDESGEVRSAEFSFIIAALALETHAARDFLYSLAVAVAVVTTFTTPYLIRASGPIAERVEQRLPRGLAVMGALYEAAVEHMRRRSASRTQVMTIRWSIIAATGAAVVVAGFIIGAEVFIGSLTFWLQHYFSISFQAAEVLLAALTMVACMLPAIAIYRATGRLAIALAARAVPEGAAEDQIRPPGWESLVEIMQVAMLIVVTVVVLAIVQPFLEPLQDEVNLEQSAQGIRGAMSKSRRQFLASGLFGVWESLSVLAQKSRRLQLLPLRRVHRSGLRCPR